MADPAASRPRNEERLFLGLVIGLVLLAGMGAWLLTYTLSRREQTHGLPPDRARTLADFTLTNAAGGTVTRADLKGKVLVVSFLFTSCSLTCPEVTRHMAEIQRLTAAQPEVRLVSLTVDPRDDTVAVLAKYGERFGADPRRWLFLTGGKTELYDLIATSFLNQDLDDPFSYMPGNFSHTERLAVVDAHGRVTAYFDGLRDDVAAVVTAEIERLRKQSL
jgi:cytochrome oxidase Cu insertion factor (SCO1/SenC/PrrC family)